MVSEPKFTIFSLNAREIVIDNVVFGFSIARSVPKIFAIEVQSYSKSRRIFNNVLALLNFRNAGPQKVVLKLSCLPGGTSRGKFRKVTFLGPKVIGAHTLNFQSIFNNFVR